MRSRFSGSTTSKAARCGSTGAIGSQGKALVVSARCDDTAVSRFSLGELGAVPLRKTIDVPYLAGHVQYLRTPGVFVCRYLDWTVSHASNCPQGVANYEPKTDGLRNPLVETGYVAVSPDLGEVLPNIPHPPSPYRELLGPRIMLDIWGHHQGTYQGDAANLRALKDNGVDHLAIISHDWQRYGYDVKLPDHLPANPQYGGDEGMIAFGRAANECGYVWSLHENYIDLYPDAPSYDPSARVLQGDGSPSKAWFNPGTKVQSFGLKCNRALDFARRNAPEIHRRYGTTAAYLDVHTCVPPWHQLDHQADQPMAAMALGKVKNDTALFQFMRDAHGGPLFGEGRQPFLLGRPLRRRRGPGGRRRGPRAAAGFRLAETPSADGQSRHGLLRTLVPPRLRHALGTRRRQHGADRQVSGPGVGLWPCRLRRQPANRQYHLGRPRASPHAPGPAALRHGPAGGDPL